MCRLSYFLRSECVWPLYVKIATRHQNVVKAIIPWWCLYDVLMSRCNFDIKRSNTVTSSWWCLNKMSRCKFDVKRSNTLTAFEIASLRWCCGSAFVIDKVFSIFLKWSVDYVLNQQYRVTNSVFQKLLWSLFRWSGWSQRRLLWERGWKVHWYYSFKPYHHKHPCIMMCSHHCIVSVSFSPFNCTFSQTHTIRCICYFLIHT